jgi:hypothetical protein
MKKFLFLILLISFCNCLFAQDTAKTKEKRKNNTIKGIIAIFPIPLSLNISLGYERYIAKNSSLSLTTNYYGQSDEGGNFSMTSIIFSYNYYFSSKYKFINNIWFGAYSLISKSSDGYDNFDCKTNGYGIGLYTGKRMYFTHKKKIFFDIGFGMSYNHDVYKYYFQKTNFHTWNPVTMQYDYTYTIVNSHEPKNYFWPRPILLLGYKF